MNRGRTVARPSHGRDATIMGRGKDPGGAARIRAPVVVAVVAVAAVRGVKRTLRPGAGTSGR